MTLNNFKNLSENEFASKWREFTKTLDGHREMEWFKNLFLNFNCDGTLHFKSTDFIYNEVEYLFAELYDEKNIIDGEFDEYIMYKIDGVLEHYFITNYTLMKEYIEEVLEWFK